MPRLRGRRWESGRARPSWLSSWDICANIYNHTHNYIWRYTTNDRSISILSIELHIYIYVYTRIYIYKQVGWIWDIANGNGLNSVTLILDDSYSTIKFWSIPTVGNRRARDRVRQLLDLVLCNAQTACNLWSNWPEQWVTSFSTEQLWQWNYTQTLSDTEASSENAPKGQILLRLVFLGCFNIKISYPSFGSHARMDTHPFTQRRFYTLRNFTAISSALEPQSVRKDGVEHLDMAVLLPFFGAHTSFHTKRFPSVPSR